MSTHETPRVEATGAYRPFSLRVDEIAAMLNFELADHPVYDGAELQWFDDARHGTGMLAFLSRRDGRRVDYYAQRGLRLDRSGYEIGGGTGSWNEIDFESARLVVADDGVDAAATFTDVDGRRIEILVDDRDGRPRKPAGLLAPVSANIERPTSLLLVWMPRFDLVRVGSGVPRIRIGGVDAAIGRLPGMRLHRRHLVKYAAPLVSVQLNPALPAAGSAEGRQRAVEGGAGGTREVAVEHAGHRARLRLEPALPDLGGLPDGARATGRWHIEVDGVRLTGGSWSAAREGASIEVGMDADERWKPGPLPLLMRVVTTVVPVFRRWPTTYRWRADIRLGERPAMTSRWERTASDGGRSYRRATGS